MISQIIRFVPAFWGWLGDMLFSPLIDWLFFGGVPTWLGVIIAIAVVVAYFIVCRITSKLLISIIAAINRVTQASNTYVLYNFRLYCVVLVFLALDAFNAFATGQRATGSRSESGLLVIGFFALIAIAVFLVCFVRLLIRAKLGVVIVLPLQLVVIALFYVYLLVLIPAMLMAGIGAAAATSGGGGNESRCPSCGMSKEKGVPCNHCGNSS